MNNEMLQLWGVAAILGMTVLAIMLTPLMRRRTPSPARRESYDITVYKDQLEELEHDLERGSLAEEQAEAARIEIKRRLLAAGDAGEQATAPEKKAGISNWALISLIGLILPVGSVVVYLGFGSPDLPDQPLAGRDMSASISETKRRAELTETVDQLAEKMASRPDDMRGWAMLGRSYVTLQRYDDAAGAYRRAYELSGNNPNAGSAYGEALALAANSAITPKATSVFEAVIAVDEANPKARYYLAMGKMQQGDLMGAMQDWIDLAAISPDDAPWMPIIAEKFSDAAAESGIDPQSVKPTAAALAIAARLRNAAGNARTQEAVAVPGPSRADVEAAAQMSEDDRAGMIRSMVDRLAGRLADNPNDKQGWIRLERAYRMLGEVANADQAANRAAALP